MKKRVRLTEEELESIIAERLKEAEKQYALDHERDLLTRQADIRALQSQINPHFLYNALESIRGQAIADHCPEIALMTQTLAKFFRYSISTKGDVVTVADELENVANYMLIQQYRFGSRFRYRVQVDEPREMVERATLPKLTLQPLVENAIVHRFSDMTEGGELLIHVSLLSGNVRILVRDNGCGIGEEMMDALSSALADLEEKEENANRHVGISNVDRRLKLCFGPEYGLEIESDPGLGTTVRVLIPLKEGSAP